MFGFRLWRKIVTVAYQIVFDDTYKQIEKATGKGFWTAWTTLVVRSNEDLDVLFEMLERAMANGHIEARYICSKNSVSKLKKTEMNNLEFKVGSG